MEIHMTHLFSNCGTVSKPICLVAAWIAAASAALFGAFNSARKKALHCSTFFPLHFISPQFIAWHLSVCFLLYFFPLRIYSNAL